MAMNESKLVYDTPVLSKIDILCLPSRGCLVRVDLSKTDVEERPIE